jgi:hypothetical protein
MTYNRVMRSEGYMIEFLDQYIRTMLWSSNDESTPEGAEPFDRNYSAKDLAPETLKRMSDDCIAFIGKAGDRLDENRDSSQGAHDFWLTRNGHGAGFWDGDWPINGDALTAISKEFGECDPYLGDDGRIYLS